MNETGQRQHLLLPRATAFPIPVVPAASHVVPLQTLNLEDAAVTFCAAEGVEVPHGTLVPMDHPSDTIVLSIEVLS